MAFLASSDVNLTLPTWQFPYEMSFSMPNVILSLYDEDGAGVEMFN